MREGEGAAGWVMTHGTARRIADLSADDDIASQGGAHGIRSWLGVPLFMYGGCEGVIAVQSSHARAFREDHQRLLESLALQIAAALQNAHLYELAMVDGLTGLFMRRYFDARIEEEIERSKRYGSSFSVIMIDVDDFKHLNDTHKHLISDHMLRSIANAQEDAARVEADARSLTAQARFTAWLVTLLPAGAAVLAELAQPGYLLSLVRTPLTGVLVVVAVGCQVAAAVLVRRIARLEGA